MAWQLSSSNGTPYSVHTSWMPSRSAAAPNMWTGMMPRVRSVMYSSSTVGSRFRLSSISANTGTAPHSRMASTLAMNVNGVVMISSPGPTPMALSAT